MRIVEPPDDWLTELLIDLSIDYAERAEAEERAARPPPEAIPITEPIDGYCVLERKTVRIKEAHRVTTMDGRPAVQGTCPDCGTRIWKLPSAR